MRIQAAESILLLVDLQARLLPAIAHHDSVLANARWLLAVARVLGIPVRVTEHCAARIGVSAPELRTELNDGEIVAKRYFSAVPEGGLLAGLDEGPRQWVVSGTEAHVCVQQTVLDLLAAGHQVFVVEEAVGSRRERDKALALERMRQNGAEIVSREMVAFEWLAHADAPAFSKVLKEYIR